MPQVAVTKPELRKSIRKYCIDCCGDHNESAKIVRKDCGGDCEGNGYEKCPLYDHRLGRPIGSMVYKTSLWQAIRDRCLDCSESLSEVKDCPFDGEEEDLCHLYNFRLGPRFVRTQK